ncbi:MAG TPA: hypothetical protein VMF91_07385 [Bryobacteraceae bacterium]|nr:hypothetical protein [Bryobacteraceae bacterium]
MPTVFWQITGLRDDMYLSTDYPVGRPAFELSQDQLATVIDLLCSGATEARKLVTPGMLEVPITIQVRKAMLKLKKRRSLTNLQIVGEYELLDLQSDDPDVLGRIDIILQFLHQFGDEEAYLGVECKRVSPGNNTLNQRYITQGVARFVTGKYALGHHWGIMLGYVLQVPYRDLVNNIDSRVRSAYGDDARLHPNGGHPLALSLHTCMLPQGEGGHRIRLLHIFVDMAAARPHSSIP